MKLNCEIKLLGSISETFRDMAKILCEIGFSLCNSEKEIISYHDGERLVWKFIGHMDAKEKKIDEFLYAVDNKNIRNVQFWRGKGNDLFVSWKIKNDCVAYEISFDGWTEEEVSEIMSYILKVILNMYKRSSDVGRVMSIFTE
ncbi:hypothetical protein [Komagataeibacter diospyri]|uniref:Uncharacterized protein n=1 Tax=Komagataeibacter diospyri TaxID=1932662 RepID=A0A4P5NTZ8_9PROT|nr:hypothetical protein [Komagataeibacter diospyri]GCE85260.1 hypothetical protein MSKU9_3401 [Komagataeibacter diospyri]